MPSNYSREEFFAYMDAWKPVLESSHKVFTQLQGGSMSGIVLIIATIGFNLTTSPHWRHSKMVALRIVDMPDFVTGQCPELRQNH